MPMPPYPVTCYTPGCGQPASYKIAARWSDGITAELKTYSLCCSACLAREFALARERSARCQRTAGETVEPPGIFAFRVGHFDRELSRLPELEATLEKSSS